MLALSDILEMVYSEKDGEGCRQRADCCSVLLLTFAEKKKKTKAVTMNLRFRGAKPKENSATFEIGGQKKTSFFFQQGSNANKTTGRKVVGVCCSNPALNGLRAARALQHPIYAHYPSHKNKRTHVGSFCLGDLFVSHETRYWGRIGPHQVQLRVSNHSSMRQYPIPVWLGFCYASSAWSSICLFFYTTVDLKNTQNTAITTANKTQHTLPPFFTENLAGGQWCPMHEPPKILPETYPIIEGSRFLFYYVWRFADDRKESETARKKNWIRDDKRLL